MDEIDEYRYGLWRDKNGRLHVLYYTLGWTEEDSSEALEGAELVRGNMSEEEVVVWSKLMDVSSSVLRGR